MSRESILLVDELVTPIPGDSPGGEPVSYLVRTELDEMRKEINPDDFDENDPLRPTELKKADWQGIIRRTIDLLRTQSKDLLLAARLTEALTKQHGFAGFAEALTLLRRMTDECWDYLHPAIEDGDLEVRAGQFNWLGDDGRGARFPYSLRTVPLFFYEGQPIGWLDWKKAQDNKGKFKMEQIDQAIRSTTRERLQELVSDIQACIHGTQNLLETLNQRLGSSAPAWIDIRKALLEVDTLVKGALQRQGGPIQANDLSTEREPNASPTADQQAIGSREPQGKRSVTRADLYAQLEEIAQTLSTLEPHSPVPYLIRRAVALGRLPFPEMMKKLLRPDYHQGLVEMDRELGLESSEENPQYR
ncbi:MAG: type VI secretion system protein TssA [Gemmataceae bacterium]